MRAAMTMSSPKARTFTWGVWGLNHCTLSFLKLWAVYESNTELLKILLVQSTVCLAYLLAQRKTMLEAKADVVRPGFRAAALHRPALLTASPRLASRQCSCSKYRPWPTLCSVSYV